MDCFWPGAPVPGSLTANRPDSRPPDPGNGRLCPKAPVSETKNATSAGGDFYCAVRQAGGNHPEADFLAIGLKVVTATLADIPETKSPTEVRLP
jgi:hypothetical protein